jgi:hypothetical protein
VKSPFIFVSEREAPLSAPGFSRLIERAGAAAKLGIKAHAHMLRHACGYPRLVDTSKGRSGADPFVIALAAAANPIMTVVTEEHPGKTKIPDVCKKEGIKFCNLADLIEQEGWKFKE